MWKGAAEGKTVVLLAREITTRSSGVIQKLGKFKSYRLKENFHAYN